MNITSQFIKSLRDNDYTESKLDGKPHFHKARLNRELSFTLLGAGWVHVYERECPSSEGWSIYNTRVSEARKLVGMV